ncbi:MAG TPA: helix-turn-helix domain-containing protein [Rhodanobacter sp.]
MTSRKSTAGARAPQRKRGHERVAVLLDTAAAYFVEKGYDAATMTEIAARAGASIGSLYQFFPTKEALALALLDRYARTLYAQMDALAGQLPDRDIGRLAARLSGLLVEFRRHHPTFAALAEAVNSLPSRHSRKIRRELRRRLAALLALYAPRLDNTMLQAAAVVTLQWMKAAVALEAEPGLRGRDAVLAQLRLALRLYLDTALKA